MASQLFDEQDDLEVFSAPILPRINRRPHVPFYGHGLAHQRVEREGDRKSISASILRFSSHSINPPLDVPSMSWNCDMEPGSNRH